MMRTMSALNAALLAPAGVISMSLRPNGS